ncbi:hypothetical protein BD779DRAFT_1545656 [Infundibulicybe gibba]|nr:hypothetical protein BD779DRAFT_1545656 [Infundibulicybe gibba]
MLPFVQLLMFISSSTRRALAGITSDFISKPENALNPLKVCALIWQAYYILVQSIIIALFKPPVPRSSHHPRRPHGRIAVIGAGLTGVSSAAHAIAHNFDVVIYESKSRDGLGGIWAHVNTTSALQLNSLAYRFHPGVLWSCGFPARGEILSQITKIWEEYHLESRTRFDTHVTSVRRATAEGADKGRARWVVNDGRDGIFDAVIVTIGTCGPPKWIKLDGMPSDIGLDSESASAKPTQDAGSPPPPPEDTDVFQGPIIHSSQLDSPTLRLLAPAGSKPLKPCCHGGGGIQVSMVARSDKWIIPRNIVIDTCLACQPFGREMPLSFLWEWFIRQWHYRGVEDLVPKKGIFEGTPVVNDDFLKHVRSGLCRYIRGEPVRLNGDGVVMRPRNSTDPKDEQVINADVIVLATGFEKPDMGFLDKTLSSLMATRPDLYLQNFSTEDWSVLMTNSSYMNAIGTVLFFIMMGWGVYGNNVDDGGEALDKA